MKKSVARRKTQSYFSYLRTKAFLKLLSGSYKSNANGRSGAYADYPTNSNGQTLSVFIQEQISKRKFVTTRLKLNPKNTYAKYI